MLSYWTTPVPLISIGTGLFLMYYSAFNLNSFIGLSGAFLVGYGLILFFCPFVMMPSNQKSLVWIGIIVLGLIYLISLWYLYNHQEPSKGGKSIPIRIVYWITGLFGLYLIGSAHWSFSKSDAFLGLLLLLYALFIAHVPFSFKPPTQNQIIWATVIIIALIALTFWHLNFCFNQAPPEKKKAT